MAHFECMVKAGRRAMASGKLHDVRIAITEVTAPSTSAQWGDDDQVECGSGVTENGQRHAPGKRQRSRQVLSAFCLYLLDGATPPEIFSAFVKATCSTRQFCKRFRG